MGGTADGGERTKNIAGDDPPSSYRKVLIYQRKQHNSRWGETWVFSLLEFLYMPLARCAAEKPGNALRSHCRLYDKWIQSKCVELMVFGKVQAATHRQRAQECASIVRLPSIYLAFYLNGVNDYIAAAVSQIFLVHSLPQALNKTRNAVAGPNYMLRVCVWVGPQKNPFWQAERDSLVNWSHNFGTANKRMKWAKTGCFEYFGAFPRTRRGLFPLKIHIAFIRVCQR